MLLWVFHLIALTVAGVAFWRLWRLMDVHPPLLRWLVAAGFILRSFLAQALFWISYLGLPFGRSLQLGNGLWFFGIDGLTYMKFALAMRNAPINLLHSEMPAPSIVYVKVLAIFAFLFGDAASVPLLLNLFSFLGTALLISGWSRRHRVPLAVTAIPVAAIACTPSWILWCLQPLKDSFFCFCIVLFALCIEEFRESWSRDMTAGQRAARLTGIGVLVGVAIYTISGIRWYYAVIGLAAASVPLTAIVFVRRPAREIAARLAAVVALIVMTSQLIVFGAASDLPPAVTAVLRPMRPNPSHTSRIVSAVNLVEEMRDNFDHYQSAGTRIQPGTAIARSESPRKPITVVATPPPVQPSRPPPSLRLAAPRSPVRPKATPPPVQPPREPRSLTLAAPRSPVTPKVTPAPQPPPPRTAIVVAESTRGRLISGLAALLLPHGISVRLGLVAIGGGRGMWWFVETDTLLVDALLAITAALLITALARGAWRDPFVWYLLFATAATTMGLAYVVSNYGTLFRHREMLVATAALLPLAIGRMEQWPRLDRGVARERPVPLVVRTAKQL